MRVLRAKKKKIIEGREKPIWNDVGFTLLIGDFNGREAISLIDERTGERYPMFENERSSPQQRSFAADNPDPDSTPF